MKLLSAWLARRKSRRASRKLMRLLIAGIERSVAFEKKVWENWQELCNTNFTAIWADYAAELGRDVKSLTTEEKKQAHLNYVLRGRE